MILPIFKTQPDLKAPRNDPNLASARAKSGGWANIQDRLMKHDSRMMKDYTDDIDTLLVFAALFSAILTTFAVGTYPLLQDDNSDVTNRLLAYQISIQAAGFNKSAYIEATISSLLTPPPSSAPMASSQWINILFFFSLVLSLAAALFGIMAKQWIREYMKWNTPLAAPRENILVRQIRFEAWQSWNVKAVMWFIPFLLELAMILFLVGVVILLWTLDNKVAIATTILVAVFLTLVSAFTISPIFFQRCPYKAPPTWVILRVFRLLDRPFGFLRSDIAPTWRQRDITSFKLTRKQLKRLRAEIGKENSHLGPHGNFINDPKSDLRVAPAYFLQDLAEVPTLLRALLWVSQTTNEPSLDQDIARCMDTLHPSPPPDSKGFAFNAHAFTNWCIISSVRSDVLEDLRVPQLLPASSEDDEESGSHSDRHSITSSRRAIGVVTETTILDARYPLSSDIILSCRPTTGLGLFATDNSTPRRHVYTILDRVIAATLASAVEPWPNSIPYHWLHTDTTLRRVYEMVLIMSNLSKIPEVNTSRMCSPEKHRYLEGLCRILDDTNDVKASLEAKAPGIRFNAYLLVSTFQQIHTNMLSGLIGLDEDGDDSDDDSTPWIPLPTSQQTMRAFPAQTVELELWTADDLSIFLWAAGHRLLVWTKSDSFASNEDIEHLLDRMATTLQTIQSLRNSHIYNQATLWTQMAQLLWKIEWHLPKCHHPRLHLLVGLFHGPVYARRDSESANFPEAAQQNQGTRLPIHPVASHEQENHLHLLRSTSSSGGKQKDGNIGQHSVPSSRVQKYEQSNALRTDLR